MSTFSAVPNLDFQPIRVLVLTREHPDHLWYVHLLRKGPNPAVDLTWCPDLTDCEDLVLNASFDLILWDCAFHTGSPHDFLQFLVGAGEARAVIALSAEADDVMAMPVLQFGAADYLCKSQLDVWSLSRAVRAAWYRLQAETVLSQGLLQDVASGFINRDLFFDRLHQALLRARRHHQRLALLSLNIDGFRTINDTFGYHAADQLILHIAQRLRGLLRRTDTLMRIGGDDLVVIAERVEDSLDVTHLINKIMDAFTVPFALNKQSVHVTASIGIATWPEAGDSEEILLKQANRAMFEAKRETGCSFRLYSEDLQQSVGRQLQLESDLRHALRGNQLVLFYQPRIDLRTGDVLGVECLLRWQHPRRGLVGPDAFIPAAEHSGLIVPIGYWVIEQACARLQEAASLGWTDLVFAVNLSFRQFHDRKMTETIFRIIYSADIDTRLLELELTESAMMHDPDYAQRCLREINQLGIRFALDDFGTGFSSLSNLQHLPIDLVKIDKSFVQRIGNQDAEHIVRAIVSLAHSLGMTVVAEGAETAGQVAFLQETGCDQVQGYYYARPMPWAELQTFLAARPVRRQVAREHL